MAKSIQAEFEEWLDPEIKTHNVIWYDYQGETK